MKEASSVFEGLSVEKRFEFSGGVDDVVTHCGGMFDHRLLTLFLVVRVVTSMANRVKTSFDDLRAFGMDDDQPTTAARDERK